MSSFATNFYKERYYYLSLVLLGVLCAVVYPYAQVAMWVGFVLAAYSAIANDSIQTIGTFIGSNRDKRWWHLWIYMGVIFLAVVTYSYFKYDGDVTWQRLTKPGLDQAPQEFMFLQLMAPLILLIMTRMKLPVSTSILLLTAFNTRVGSTVDILSKSLAGYFIAFVAAIIVWTVVSRLMRGHVLKKPAAYWTVLQWVTSGFLWGVWIAQDAANVAVYLPRSLNGWQFIAFAGTIFAGLGVLFYLRGDKIQGIVDEKSGLSDVRSATLVDLVYGIILFYKLQISTTPMSTTWVFIGLLGGRELAIAVNKRLQVRRKITLKRAAGLASRDVLRALIGLVVSVAIAVAINPKLREEVMSLLGF